MKNFNKYKISGMTIFLFCLLFSSTVSIYYGKDLSWDLANYHYYNPYAFLHHRESLDYWPTSFVQYFFFPTADFFSYFLINHFKPFTTVFLMGALQGLNIWFTYLIVYYFIHHRLFALLLALLGTYSALIFASLGDFTNDHMMNIFVLMYIYLQIKMLSQYSLRKEQKTDKQKTDKWFSPYSGMIMLSGFVLGLALGIKLTAGIYVIGAVIANFLLPISLSNRVKYVLILMTGITFAFLLTSGYWMILLWQKYHNPLFPFFNGIFHSPYFPEINFHYSIFLPKKFLQIIFYPLYFSISGTSTDGEFMDLRFAITFLLFMIFGIKWLYQKLQGKSDTGLSLIQNWLFAFTIFSYVAWESYFAIVRYIGVIALLSPLLIYLLITNLISHKMYRFYLLFFLFAYMVITMAYAPIVRISQYDSDYFNIYIPMHFKQTQNGLVLMAYPAFAISNQPKPQTYLIPFFPANWRFVGIPFENVSNAHLAEKDRLKISRIIQTHQNTIYLLSSKKSISSLYRIAQSFGLVPNGMCEIIRSDRAKISYAKTYICPVKKIK